MQSAPTSPAIIPPSDSDFRDYPIPAAIARPDEVSYRHYPVNQSLPESRDPLVDALASGLAGRSFYARTDGLNAPYHRALDGSLPNIWLRRTLVEKLHRVNDRVRPYGLEVFLLDGYRTIACQMDIYNYFIEIARAVLPDPTPEACREYVKDYIGWPGDFDPANPLTWISHKTGAAVDLTLREIASGEHVYMGGIFDDPSSVSTTCFFEQSNGPAGASANEARRNRRLLFWAMWHEEFANLPEEWWHFDYGDQLWAKNRRFVDPALPIVTAWYGPVSLPDE
ncbi:MAG: zinc D-Ala-D-Ala dipeptidase [Candidatus Sumerlaeota bacterium]|nr:zinc D-Ala-D-Ala dipeptidase [Candidatus Sumerlaeota bacterium]